MVYKPSERINLPEIQLPTENGKLVELPDFTEEHGEFEEELENEAEEVRNFFKNNLVQDFRKKILIYFCI